MSPNATIFPSSKLSPFPLFRFGVSVPENKHKHKKAFVMPLTEQTLDKLRNIVDASCADQKSDIPGTTVVVVGRDGEELFVRSAGTRGLASGQDMTLDNVYWIASCTKMLTGVACMQLVERGVLALDDGDQLEGLCTELQDLEVMRPDGSLEPKKRKITLRMLLSHTAGFGYSFFNERLRDWGRPVGIDELSGRIEDMIQPLMFQPGERWEYGVSWRGFLCLCSPQPPSSNPPPRADISLSRSTLTGPEWLSSGVTGTSLNSYLQTNVFQPLGIKDMSMFPTKDMKSRLAYMHVRESDGTLRTRDHLYRQPLVCETEADISRCFNSGGAGMFAKPQEYCSKFFLTFDFCFI